MGKTIDQITREKTLFEATDRFAGRDDSGDFKTTLGATLTGLSAGTSLFSAVNGFFGIGTAASIYPLLVYKSLSNTTTRIGIASIVSFTDSAALGGVLAHRGMYAEAVNLQTSTLTHALSIFGGQFLCKNGLAVGSYRASGLYGLSGEVYNYNNDAGVVIPVAYGLKSIVSNVGAQPLTNAYLCHGSWGTTTNIGARYGVYMTGEQYNYLSGILGIGVAADASYALKVTGNAYFSADVSALTFTDRTPAPKNKAEAYAMVKSMTRKAGTEGIDHDTLHEKLKRRFTHIDRIPDKDENGAQKYIVTGTHIDERTGEIEEIREPIFIEVPVDCEGRDLSLLVSAMAEVINDLTARIAALE